MQEPTKVPTKEAPAETAKASMFQMFGANKPEPKPLETFAGM
jgi:hypothetical protein